VSRALELGKFGGVYFVIHFTLSILFFLNEKKSGPEHLCDENQVFFARNKLSSAENCGQQIPHKRPCLVTLEKVIKPLATTLSLVLREVKL
jgi:hypothetical protein